MVLPVYLLAIGGNSGTIGQDIGDIVGTIAHVVVGTTGGVAYGWKTTV